MKTIFGNRKRIILCLIGVLLIAVAVFGIIFFTRGKSSREKEVDELKLTAQEPVIPLEIEKEEPIVEVTQDIADSEIEYATTLNFDVIKAQCDDIYAWIEIPGTDVDYPVLCGKEDDYYLRRGMDGSYQVAGCLYSNLDNSLDFSDFAHVIYGHDMNDESMFGSLRRFYDKEFFDEYDEIIIYTADTLRKYKIVETRRYSDLYIYDEFDGYSENGRKAFLEMLGEDEDNISHIRSGEEYSIDDRFIVLSTCINGEPDNRFLVIGKLEEELPASAT